MTLSKKNKQFLDESCRLLQEMYKDSEQYLRKVYKINLNDKEGITKLLYEAEEIFYDLTYPKILKKIHNFSALYDQRVKQIQEHLGIQFSLQRRNWDQLILKFIALTSQTENENEQVCLIHTQTSVLLYTLFTTNVFYSDKIEYQKFLMQYFLRYLSGRYESKIEGYDYYEQNFNKSINGIYLKTEKKIQKLKENMNKFEGKEPTKEDIKKINDMLEKGEKLLEENFSKVIKQSLHEIQEEFFGTFMFYRDIVKKKQKIDNIEEEQSTENKRRSIVNSSLIKHFKNFELFEDVDFPLEPNQQDNFIDHYQKILKTLVAYGDFIIKKVDLDTHAQNLSLKLDDLKVIQYEQNLFDILLKTDYENHIQDYEFQLVHNQAIINLYKRLTMMTYQSFLKWKFDIKNLRTKYNKVGRVLMFRNYELEQIFFSISKSIKDLFNFNKHPSQWDHELIYDDKAIKENGLSEEDIKKIFEIREQHIEFQQQNLKKSMSYYKESIKMENYFKTFLFYNQRILTNKPLNEIMEIQSQILHEQKTKNKLQMNKTTSLLVKNYTESFFFLVKISKQIKNENPETRLKKILLKLHKAGNVIEYSAVTILNKIFSFLTDTIFQLVTDGLKEIILYAVQTHCRENGETVPEKFSEIDLFQRVDAWLLPVTKYFRENEIIDDEVLKEVEDYQKNMPDQLHKKLLRFRVENFDYDKKYFESNDKVFNDLVVSNFLAEKL